MQFSSYDVDNDHMDGENCAAHNGGNAGNWYWRCHTQMLNGRYGRDGDEGNGFMYWANFGAGKPYNMALQRMRWMIREVV